jgi:hypothetical protein
LPAHHADEPALVVEPRHDDRRRPRAHRAARHGRQDDHGPGTLIRHYLQAELAQAVLHLPPCVIDTSIEVRLVKRVRRAVPFDSPAPTTRAAAVALASPARLADRERHPAPAAQQQVQHHLRYRANAHRRRPRRGVDSNARRCHPSTAHAVPFRPGRATTRRGFFISGARRYPTSDQPGTRLRRG